MGWTVHVLSAHGWTVHVLSDHEWTANGMESSCSVS